MITPWPERSGGGLMRKLPRRAPRQCRSRRSPRIDSHDIPTALQKQWPQVTPILRAMLVNFHSVIRIGHTQLDGRMWPEFALPAADGPLFESSWFHETLTQYFTRRQLVRLRNRCAASATPASGVPERGRIENSIPPLFAGPTDRNRVALVSCLREHCATKARGAWPFEKQ